MMVESSSPDVWGEIYKTLDELEVVIRTARERARQRQEEEEQKEP